MYLHSCKYAHAYQVCAKVKLKIMWSTLFCCCCRSPWLQQTQGQLDFLWLGTQIKPDWASIQWTSLVIVSIQSGRIELCGSSFCFLKQAPTCSEGSESAGMGGIKVTSQRHGSAAVNKAASTVNSSISQDLRGLMVDVSHQWGMCTQAVDLVHLCFFFSFLFFLF